MSQHTEMSEDIIYLKKAQRLYEALTSDKGLRGILAAAETVFDNPVLIADMNFKLVSYTGGMDIDNPIWKQIIQNGYYPESYVQEVMKKEEDYRSIFGNEPPLLMSDESDPARYISKMIVVDCKPVGFSTCMEYYREITHLDIRLFETFCKIVGTELRNDENIKQLRSHRYEYFMSELLSGNIKTEYMEERLKQAELKLKRHLYVLAIEFADEKMQREYHMDYYKTVLEQVVPDGHCIVYQNNFVLLISRGENNLPTEAFMKNISAQLKVMNMTGGISHRFLQLEYMNTYYKQACEAIRVGRLIEPEKFLYCYSDYYCYHIFKQLQQTSELKSFCSPKLMDIIEYDAEYKTDYTKTAYMYLKSNKNPALTAKYLHIHRNTIDYRITRLRELFNLNFYSSETFSLMLSFNILRYTSSSPFPNDWD